MKFKSLLFGLLGLMAHTASAGTDVVGKIKAFQVDDGSLRFQLEGSGVSTYCQGGWAGLNFIVQKTDPQFPYYFAQVMAAHHDNLSVYVGNISALGTSNTYCEVAKTGYGLLVFK